MESGKSQFKMTFRIEQLPDGTFVGKSDNPKFEIKGATPQEVQQKIQSSMGARIIERLGIHLSASVTGDGVEVTGSTETTTETTTETSATNAAPAPGSSSPGVFSSPSPAFLSNEAAEISGTAPITAEPIDAGSVRAQKLLGFLLFLAIALGMLWWFFER